jgi:hypothetical protein
MLAYLERTWVKPKEQSSAPFLSVTAFAPNIVRPLVESDLAFVSFVWEGFGSGKKSDFFCGVSYRKAHFVTLNWLKSVRLTWSLLAINPAGKDHDCLLSTSA